MGLGGPWRALSSFGAQGVLWRFLTLLVAGDLCGVNQLKPSTSGPENGQRGHALWYTPWSKPSTAARLGGRN